MTDVIISLSESGRNSTTLRAAVGNDLHIAWILTDVQLAHLAAEAVRIVKRRAGQGLIEADGLRAALARLVGESEPA
jgi:hypothetical protein